MRWTARLGILAAAVVLAATAFAEPVMPAKRVKVLATGGTIAGAQASATDYGYKSGAYDVNTLISAVPNLDKLAQITGEQVANIGSQDMNDAVWLQLAKRLDEVLKGKDTDAVLITHGTDTLEETSYFLSLVTKSAKPVVMVGSMRPATATSADGPANIYNGVAAAIDPGARGRGVLVSLNDEIHYARNVVKTDTTSLQTFASLNRGPAGLVLNPGYTGAFTVTRHNYIKYENVSNAGGSAVTNSAVMWFDAAAGTHSAVSAHTGAGTPTLGAGNAPVTGDPDAWIKVNVNGTIMRFPCWA